MDTIKTNTGRDITLLLNQSKIIKLVEQSEMWKFPFERRKKKDEEFANCLIIDSAENTWYKELIGMEVFCSISFRDYKDGKGKVLTKASPCINYKNIIIEGRDFNPNDIIIL